MAEEMKETTMESQTQEGGTQQEEGSYDKFSAFDEKPDYIKGGYANPDEEEEKINPQDFENKPEDETKGAGEPPAQEEPFSKISYGGIDYKFGSKEQLESMAQRGLYLSEQEDRLRSYSQVIEMAERNPALGAAITQLIQQYAQTGQIIPLNVPQPQTKYEDPNKEPEQGENEDYDDYEKRLAQWKDARINSMVEQRVQQILSQNQQQQQRAAVAQYNRNVVNYCYGDPDRQDVIARMTNDEWCAPQLRALADQDGMMFMRVYDDIKRAMGKPPFYGAPSLAPQSQQQPAQVPAQKQPQKSAPFSERAGNVSAAKSDTSQKELPDFKQMSDAEFRKFKDSLRFGNFE